MAAIDVVDGARSPAPNPQELIARAKALSVAA